jgi:hypothetical protein
MKAINMTVLQSICQTELSVKCVGSMTETAQPEKTTRASPRGLNFGVRKLWSVDYESMEEGYIQLVE